jgi:hypothetical protein
VIPLNLRRSRSWLQMVAVPCWRSPGTCGPQLVPSYESSGVDNYRVIAGQKLFSSVGMAVRDFRTYA